jgi:hypothetical protein
MGSANVVAEPAQLEFFEKKVRPLLAARCYKCHSTAANKTKGGLALDSRSRILKGGGNGPVVAPGNVDQSLLIKAVRYQDESLRMPPDAKLSAGEIAILEEWIRRGAAAPDAPVPQFDWAKARRFWSFQPPKTMPPPTVRDRAWTRKPIDAFVLAELEKRALSPAPAADARTLIRRMYFDVLGLPPTPEDVSAFVEAAANDRATAVEALVDRLLASPHYGERWGRYWLDLVRYCDVAEPWFGGKGQPHLYRDWIIKALNDDMPYDRFVQMQLAADQMTGTTLADRAALGLFGLSPVYWKELKLDKDVIRTVVAEEWEERIDALCGTFLGLTVACARCHDHKFDPIAQTDYYALAGVFASIRQVDRPLLPDADARRVTDAMEEIRKIEEQIVKLGTPKKPEETKQSVEHKAKIEQLKKTPGFDAPIMAVIEDTSLFVHADGPHRTKLEYKPGVAQDVAVQMHGNPASPGEVVRRRFLSVLTSDAPAFRQGSGRLELATAIVCEGAPLSARVIVNRVWKHHFGAGLVETPSDFGSQGARPSHPELLDDLTARFIANGRSLKWLHREILLSATYQQTSNPPSGKAHAVDPDNRLLWKMPRRKLDVEAWRDAMLAVNGALEHKLGGPALDLGDPKNNRRTLYGRVKRRELADLLRLHDFPDPVSHSAGRTPTTTPLQQLFVLNSPFLQQQATALAKRLRHDSPESDEERIRRAYSLLYNRVPSDKEMKLATRFLATGQPEARWIEYAQVLLGSNEFLFVD